MCCRERACTCICERKIENGRVGDRERKVEMIRERYRERTRTRERKRKLKREKETEQQIDRETE